MTPASAYTASTALSIRRATVEVKRSEFRDVIIKHR